MKPRFKDRDECERGKGEKVRKPSSCQSQKKKRRKRISNYSQLDQTIKRIAEEYRPGTIKDLIKKHPDVWSKIQRAESTVNKACIADDSSRLEKALARWEKLWRGSRQKAGLITHTKKTVRVGSDRTGVGYGRIPERRPSLRGQSGTVMPP